MDQQIVQSAKEFATEKLANGLPPYAKYHDLEHTLTVASEVRDLALKEGIETNNIRCLEVAAWFHDLGYLQRIQGHEALSAEIADEFLSKQEISKEERELVHRLIHATEMTGKPQDKLEMLMRDADLAHLGLEVAAERSDLLRQEREILLGHSLKKSDWAKMNVEFFEKHGYFTDAAKEKYGPQKDKYQKSLKEKVKKKSKKEKPKSTKNKGRGVETMFRVTLKNHTALSQIADNKANIMLSINAIIISIVLTSLLPKLDNNAYLLWPSVLLLTVCIVAVIFATISTIPKVTRNGTNPEMVKNRKTNLLFFANFQGLDLDVYLDGMKDVMENEDYLYESLIKDLYYLGKVLNKKYRYLRLCYTVFVVGIVLSVLAYMLSLYFMFQGPA
ncbi:MAG TPA: Pycsar system effector family protein [Cryomorphaceae bacterium]|nr:Pycsar system effector family protein [Cryomorphaceae bacterium]